MTYNEIINIAKRLDDETKERIDQEVAERLEILKLGDLNEEQMDKMEECLYMSLVIQEYLDGEYELIDEERAFLLAEMEELYGEYNDLLLKAKLEEKVSKKKRLALELMRIREKLFHYKDRMKDVKQDMKTNRKNKSDLEDLSSKNKMKEVAKENKKGKWGLDGDTEIGNQKRSTSKKDQLTGEDLRNPSARSEIERIVQEKIDAENTKQEQHDNSKRENEAVVREGESSLDAYLNAANGQIGSVTFGDNLVDKVNSVAGRFLVDSYDDQNEFSKLNSLHDDNTNDSYTEAIKKEFTKRQ